MADTIETATRNRTSPLSLVTEDNTKAIERLAADNGIDYARVVDALNSLPDTATYDDIVDKLSFGIAHLGLNRACDESQARAFATAFLAL